MQLIQNDVIQRDVKERFRYTALVLSLGLAGKFLYFFQCLSWRFTVIILVWLAHVFP